MRIKTISLHRLKPVPVGLLLAVFLASGCAQPERRAPSSEEDEPAPRPSARPEPEPEPVADAGEVDPLAEEVYSYNPIGKRDPFRSFLVSSRDNPTEEEPLGPLQRYEIDQYRLVGIVWGQEEPRAMVQDPEGIGHVVTVGTLIGKNWGQVTQIKPDEMVITEEYRDEIENKLIVNEIPIRLPDPSQAQRDPGRRPGRRR